MKKLICMILAALLLVSLLATTAFAAGHSHGRGRHVQPVQRCVPAKVCEKEETCTNACTYTDANGDDLCDNCSNQCADCGMTQDENKDGICDNCGQCSHYRDENQDGICDHQAECEKSRTKSCNNAGSQTGCHGRKNKHHH